MGLEDLQKPETTTEEHHTPEKPEAKPEEEKVYTRKAYAGLQTRLNQANERIKDLESQFDTMNTGKAEAEQLADQRFQALTTANAKIKEYTDQVAPLAGLQNKVTAFRELVASEEWGLTPDATIALFGLLDDLPAGADVEATKETIKRLAKFGQTAAQQAAQQTEQEVTEGVTPGYQGSAPGGQDPTTAEGWARAVAGKDPSDPIWGKYFDWSMKQ